MDNSLKYKMRSSKILMIPSRKVGHCFSNNKDFTLKQNSKENSRYTWPMILTDEEKNIHTAKENVNFHRHKSCNSYKYI